MLSYLYMLRSRQAQITVSMVGFDPYLEFLHTPHHGRPALALGIMEEFRPIVCDSVCIGLISNGSAKATDFVAQTTGVAMSDTTRRKVTMAFEARMD